MDSEPAAGVRASLKRTTRLPTRSSTCLYSVAGHQRRPGLDRVASVRARKEGRHCRDKGDFMIMPAFRNRAEVSAWFPSVHGGLGRFRLLQTESRDSRAHELVFSLSLAEH